MIGEMPFGKTGHESTRIIFGACALWDVEQKTADETLDYILDRRISHIDTTAVYVKSEERIGNVE